MFDSISFEFDVRKATQAACMLLKLRGGTMSHLKLIKLLYILDREALRRWTMPVTGDSFVSMSHGPVLSMTYDLMNTGDFRAGGEPTYWGRHISDIGDYEVKLKNAEFSTDDLSEAEIELIKEVFERFGAMSRWELRDYTHSFREWEDPGQSSTPIHNDFLLHCLGKTEEEIARVREENLNLRQVQNILKSA